jgi:hypothetical protein
MPIAVFLAALLMVAGGAWFLFGRWRIERMVRREYARLAPLSADALAGQARGHVEVGGWRTMPAGAALLARDSGWTDAALLAALTALHGELHAEDVRTGRGGRGHAFNFHDLGAGTIVDVLRARLGE